MDLVETDLVPKLGQLRKARCNVAYIHDETFTLCMVHKSELLLYFYPRKGLAYIEHLGPYVRTVGMHFFVVEVIILSLFPPS